MVSSQNFMTFKFCLAQGLHKFITLAFETMMMPASWQEMLMVSIPKERKDLSYPQSYKPILLLNVDYKILTSVLAYHLMNVAQHIISPDQSGFLKGSYLSDCF